MNKRTKACHCCDGSGKELNHVVIGAEMRALRHKVGLSLQEMANRMGFTKPYLSDLERGKRNWNDDLIAAYRKAKMGIDQAQALRE